MEVKRFIPACAGNIHSASVIVLLKAVHPRVCGEHGKLANFYDTNCGSSPRVRGTLL